MGVGVGWGGGGGGGEGFEHLHTAVKGPRTLYCPEVPRSGGLRVMTGGKQADPVML